MTSNEYAPDILAFSESQSNQNGRSLFKRTTITKGDPNQEAPFDSLQTIPHAQVEEVLTYSNFPFSNKSQLSIQGTQEDLDKLFALDKSNVQKTIQVIFEPFSLQIEWLFLGVYMIFLLSENIGLME